MYYYQVEANERVKRVTVPAAAGRGTGRTYAGRSLPHPTTSLKRHLVHNSPPDAQRQPPAMTETDLPKAMPASKLGEYKVIKEIAEGTFGKVKSASCHWLSRAPRPETASSGYPHAHWPQCGHEISIKTSH
jgi:hypothetical protein